MYKEHQKSLSPGTPLPNYSKKTAIFIFKAVLLYLSPKGKAVRGELFFWVGEPVKNGTVVNVFFGEIRFKF